MSILYLRSGNLKDKRGRTLCLDCHYLAGSCCLEFGADDLWRETGAGTT